MAAPIIFDRALLRARRRRALRLGPETFLIDRVAADFDDRLAVVLRRFDLAADIGTPTNAVREALARSGSVGTVIAVDRVAAAFPRNTTPSPSPLAGEGWGGGSSSCGADTRQPPTPTRGTPKNASAFFGDPPDPSPQGGGEKDRWSAGDRGPRIVADEEALPLAAGSLDLVVSGLALQTVNDLPGALVQIRRALRPDGLFLAALLGGDTLNELRQSFAAAESELEGGASPRVAPFADLRDMGALLQRAGFALPVTDTDRVTVRYATPIALMLDLRRMGATNPLVERRRVPLRRAALMRAIDIYAARFADSDGRVRASFDIVWLSGWAPHESQQQPLQPGSAKMRLADALGTQEIGTGEKPEP
jgi:SAM-dependent methyltransferase